MKVHAIAYKSEKQQDIAASVDAAMVMQLNRLEKYTSNKGQLGTAISAEAYFETITHPTEPWVCYMVPDDYLDYLPPAEMTEEEAAKEFRLYDVEKDLPAEIEASKVAEAEPSPGIVAKVLSVLKGLVGM